MKVSVKDLIVYLDAAVQEKIDHWVRMAKGEVSGLGLVTELTENGLIWAFQVTDVFLAEQSCNGSETLISPEATARLMLDLDTRGFDTGRLKFWFHSHGDMKVFWSNTDDATIGGFRPKDYFISQVVNKEGKELCRVDIFRPILICLDEVRTDVIIPSLGLEEQCKKEFAAKVRESLFSWTPAPKPKTLSKEQLKNLSEEEITNMLCTGELDWWELEEFEQETFLDQIGGAENDNW